MLAFGMRLGNDPRLLVTTTPRPVKLIRELLADEGRGVVVTRGTSYQNVGNVPPQVFKRVQRYEGTRLGRQELLAELLDDADQLRQRLFMCQRVASRSPRDHNAPSTSSRSSASSSWRPRRVPS